MSVHLERRAQAFRDDLRERGLKKRRAALDALKKRSPTAKTAKPEKIAPATSALIAVRDALQALSDLIVAQGKQNAGPVEFEVTGRDLEGKIKSFKVRG